MRILLEQRWLLRREPKGSTYAIYRVVRPDANDEPLSQNGYGSMSMMSIASTLSVIVFPRMAPQERTSVVSWAPDDHVRWPVGGGACTGPKRGQARSRLHRWRRAGAPGLRGRGPLLRHAQRGAQEPLAAAGARPAFVVVAFSARFADLHRSFRPSGTALGPRERAP